VLAAALPAQTSLIVSPAAYATVNGSGGNSFPFGSASYSHWRYQQIHNDLPSTFKTINGLAWRRAKSTSTYGAFTFDVQIDMSTAATPTATPVTAFDSNHGKDRITVVFGPGGPGTYLAVNWPATTPPAAEPAPFEYRLPFLLPFVFQNAPVCWEIRIMNRQNSGGGSCDYIGNAAMARIKWSYNMSGLKTSTYGTGCTASDQTSASYASVSGTRSAGNWAANFYLYLGKKSSTALWILGADTANWMGRPLPYSLPGSTCNLLVAPLAGLGPARATSTSGSVTQPLAFPDDPSFAGVKLYIQWLFLDAGLPLGVGLSRATLFQFPDPAAWPPATAEYAWGNQGLITEFTVL